MLDLLAKHSSAFSALWLDIIDDPKYKYMFPDGYADYEFQRYQDTWAGHDFVSYTEATDTINGFFSAKMDRTARQVSSVMIARFNDSMVFEKDLIRFMKKLLLEYGYHKVCFIVVVGNPAEAFYDRFVESYGGSIVGVHKEHCMLVDGERYDMKTYEILSRDFKEALKCRSTSLQIGTGN